MDHIDILIVALRQHAGRPSLWNVPSLWRAVLKQCKR
ncbi:hypothetical protein B0G75_104268 [Paraburkholderia sp. BL18I3N2]|nr:hypothetical protein B0G75_104268 [Paraburkholderia sp. BL18I3N2]